MKSSASREATVERAQEAVPSTLRATIRRASEHHTLTLAAGLAFFGILSIGPAVGVGFGLVHLVASPEAADMLADLVEDTFSEQLGLGDLFEQMEDRAARYAGIGLVVLLWPATTLASGWARALDATMEVESPGGMRGIRGRFKGLVPGGVLVAALFMLLAAVIFTTALAGGDQVLVLTGIIAGAVVLQFVFNLMIYRWLPSESRPLRELWPGAALATVGVVAATVGFAGVLAGGEQLAQRYPPSLTTAIVLGLWLYAANSCLLLAAEYNEARLARSRG